jgi:chromosome segregation ATPase
MAEEKGLALTPIAIAIIGLIGSLGGAWITTGSKFESELRENQASVKNLQSEIESVKNQLSGKIDEANRQLATLRELLGSAQKENETLQASLNDLKSQIDAANKTVAEAKEVNQRLITTRDSIRTIDPGSLRTRDPKLTRPPQQ